MLGAHGTSDSSRRRPAMWATAIGMLLAWWPSGSPAAECDPVSVALGKTAVSECPQLDADGDGVVSLAEILSGGASGLVARGGGGQVSIDVGSASGAPCCSILPWLRMTMRSASVIASTWSWVT